LVSLIGKFRKNDVSIGGNELWGPDRRSGRDVDLNSDQRRIKQRGLLPDFQVVGLKVIVSRKK
jgi:hypothetical protein